MKLRLAVVVLVGTMAAAVSGFASHSEAASGGASTQHATIATLRVGLDASPSTVNPAMEGQTFITDSMGLENLLRIGPNNSLQPWLAQSVTQPSPATYVYHLRHGVKFWDGNEMTAADVANALNYYRYPTSLMSAFYTSVKNIKAVGRYAVWVTLKHPDARWKYVPALYGWIFEQKFQDAHKATMGQPGTLIMGTGPFEYDSIDPTSGIELSANPHYWGGPVKIQHISVKYIPDPTSLALAMRAGAIDVAPDISDVTAFNAAIGSAGKVVPSTNGACGIQGPIEMNTKVAPWSDVHVRRAVAYAINRADIATAAGLPGAIPLYTLISPPQLQLLASPAQVAKLLNSLPTYHFNLAKAKQELAQSAYPSGFSYTWGVTSLFGTQNIAEAIAGDLSKIGINITVKTVSFGAWFSEFAAPHTAGINIFGFGCDNPDPALYPSTLLGDRSLQGARPENFPQYNPPGMNALVQDGITTTNKAKRFAIYSKILQMLGTDVPYVPLVTSPSFAAVSNNLTWKGFGNFEVNGDPWPLDISAS